MGKCIESLLIGGDEVEIIIVDDGSVKDNTAKIADEYADKYPGIVKAVHKENGGHGSAVNTGIDSATGLYFKVVDSDDWVEEESYRQVLDTLRRFSDEKDALDMMVCNYVYEKEGEKNKKVIQYRHSLPAGKCFGWEDCKHFQKGHYILMHSVIFRTKMLRACGIRLPEHTFYVDNLYVFEPLPFVKRMYYLDVDFYRYYIGRADQSVNEEIMISRIDQQIKVNKIMIDYLVEHMGEIENRNRLCQYMKNYLEIITTISSVLLIKSGTEDNLNKKEELWRYLERKDTKLFRWMRHGLLGIAMNLPGSVGRMISVDGYKVAQKIFKFN